MLNTLFVVCVIAVVTAACIQLRPVRAEVYGRPRRTETSSDPAIARVLAARAKRAEARELLARDPALARELGIGRPDLRRGYDDGGLLDINTSPAALIADVVDIDLAYAEAIVAARERRGGNFFNVSEVLVDVDLPLHVRQQLEERAIA